ncbi:MAG: hypothetical protein PHT40_03805 [Patescibacteria group bacterium]|nr:hypothetical protein [Patescibacteria group bacterium]
MLQFAIGNEKRVHDEVDRPWYDTKNGIAESLKSLEGLNRLINERHTAGYERKERLNEFHILGRYALDTCGNCSKASEVIPKDFLPNIPDVLTQDESCAYIRKHAGKGFMLSFTINGGDLPLPGLKCAHCGTSWNIQNCHDTVVWHTTEVFPLTDFVGETLHSVKVVSRHWKDAIYRMQSDILIRNSKHINLLPKYPKPEHDWQKSIVKNEHGWLAEKDGISDDYVIQPGDEGYFNIWRYYHGTCNRDHLRREEERQFREIFEKAGFKITQMNALSNEYCSCDHCAPWFTVGTGFGLIKIGWRKRVIKIDWNAMAATLKACNKLPKKSIISLFQNEDVTKGENFIHAWGWEKAEEYLSRIHAFLSEK